MSYFVREMWNLKYEAATSTPGPVLILKVSLNRNKKKINDYYITNCIKIFVCWYRVKPMTSIYDTSIFLALQQYVKSFEILLNYLITLFSNFLWKNICEVSIRKYLYFFQAVSNQIRRSSKASKFNLMALNQSINIWYLFSLPIQMYVSVEISK